MHQERDIMHRFVFPELKRRGRCLNVDLVPIDLRWGIDFANGKESNFPVSGIEQNDLFRQSMRQRQQVEACLDEIDRSNIFIGILSKRYGSKPKLKYSMTSKLQKRLQTIDNLNIEDVLEGNVSVTELEMRYAMSKAKNKTDGPIFFFLRFFDVPPPSTASNGVEDHKRLISLKNDVLSSQFHNESYYTKINKKTFNEGKLEFNGIATFGKMLLENLWNYVKNEYRKVPGETLQKIQLKYVKQEGFAKARAEEFAGRKKLVNSSITTVLNACNKGSIVNVSALKPGVGTTSLLCKTYSLLKSTKSMYVIPYFYIDGNYATHEHGHEDSPFVEMLHYLYKRLKEVVGIHGEDDETTEIVSEMDGNSICKSLSILLQNCNSVSKLNGAKIVLFVDGLEHFLKASLQKVNNNRTSMTTSSIAAGFLQWLPQTLPQNVAVVISTSQNSHISKILSSVFEGNVQTFPIGSLDYADRKDIARQMLKEHGKVLDESNFNNQLGTLVGKRDAGNVSYLKLLCQEMASFGVYEELRSKLDCIGETSEKLLDEILQRAEKEVGKALVISAIHLLLTSQLTGLSQSVLELALSKVQEMHAHHRDDENVINTGVPFVNLLQVAVLLNSLDEFLTPTQGSIAEGTISLKRGLHMQRVCMRYLQAKNNCDCLQMKNLHKILSQVYQSLYSSYPVNTKVDPNILHSLTYHLAACDDIKLLEHTVCNLNFIQQCASSGKYLMKWLQLLLTTGMSFGTDKIRSQFLASTRVSMYSNFIDVSQDTLLSEPSLLVQLALNERDGSLIKNEAKQLLKFQTEYANQNCPKYIILDENRNFSSSSKENLNLISTKKITTKSKVISATIETPRADLSIENLLSAHGLFDGSIIISLAMNTVELFRLLGQEGYPIRLNFYSLHLNIQFIFLYVCISVALHHLPLQVPNCISCTF